MGKGSDKEAVSGLGENILLMMLVRATRWKFILRLNTLANVHFILSNPWFAYLHFLQEVAAN